MGSVALILEFSGVFPSVFPFTFIPMMYLSIGFIIAFSGFLKYKDKNFNTIRIQNLKLLSLFENVLLYGGFGSLFFFLPFAISGLSGDVELNRLDIFGFQESVLAKYGIINSIFSLFANLFIFAILLAFIRFADKDNLKSRGKGYLLLLSSFSYVVYVLAYVGRDGIVYWLMSYSFIYLVFKRFISITIKKKLFYQYFISIGILIVPFMIISIARFSAMAEGVGWKLLEYAGCQLKNFNDSFYVDPPLLYGRLAFPIFLDILETFGISFEKALVQDRFPYYLSLGVDPWIFKTFIGDLLMDFGKIGTLLYLIFFSVLARFSLKKVSIEGTFTFSNLILFILLYQMILWGVFYFRFYSMNFYIIAVILIALSFKIFKSYSEEKLIVVLRE